jgi:hypothetical protein
MNIHMHSLEKSCMRENAGESPKQLSAYNTFHGRICWMLTTPSLDTAKGVHTW